MSSPTGPAEQFAGGSFPRSISSIEKSQQRKQDNLDESIAAESEVREFSVTVSPLLILLSDIFYLFIC